MRQAQVEQTTPCFADGIELCVRHLAYENHGRSKTSVFLIEQPPTVNPVHLGPTFGPKRDIYYIPLPWVYYNVTVSHYMAYVTAICISPAQVGTRRFRPCRLPLTNLNKYHPCYAGIDLMRNGLPDVQEDLRSALNAILLWQDSAAGSDYLGYTYRDPLAREIAEMAHQRYGDMLHRYWSRTEPVSSTILWTTGFFTQLLSAWEKLSLTDIMDLSYPSGGRQQGLWPLWEEDVFFPSCFTPDGQRTPHETHSL